MPFKKDVFEVFDEPAKICGKCGKRIPGAGEPDPRSPKRKRLKIGLLSCPYCAKEASAVMPKQPMGQSELIFDNEIAENKEKA